MAAGPTLFLIDGSNQMYRAYHAIRALTRSDGKSTNATYGFITMLRKLLADHQPQYIAASFDLRGQTFRSQLSADYKANREAMPDDLAEQIDWVHQACEALGVPILTAPGFEADDVIGTLAQAAARQGIEVVISSGDKDLSQLVNQHIMVIDTMNASLVAGKQWRWNPVLVLILFGAMGLSDLIFFVSNSLKIPEGGWLPLLIAGAVFIGMDTWRRGRRVHLEKVRSESLPLNLFLERADKSALRVAGLGLGVRHAAEGVCGKAASAKRLTSQVRLCSCRPPARFPNSPP